MRIVLAIFAMLVVAPVVRATVLLPAEFREIVSGSEVIVYGRVLEARAEWADNRHRIDTVVTVQAGTYLKGGPGDTVTFRVPGGQIGVYRNVMVGAPELRTGDEAVFFLVARGPEVPHIFGLSQGLFRVRVEGRGERRIVVPPALMAKGDSPEVVTRGAADRQSRPLEVFAAQVRAVIAAKGGDR
jgi:hypothetical protein